jgi:hypothetical protein
LSENLESAVNDASRKIKIRGKQAIVPLKFDAAGSPATAVSRIFKRLNLDDLRFLKLWRAAGWDINVAQAKSGMDAARCAKLIKRLSCFRDEEARVRALCEIPTPDWICAKHVENIYAGGKAGKSEQKSLEELAKIEGAYKQTSPTQVNIFNLPKLTPEVEAKFKQLAEQALDAEQVA